MGRLNLQERLIDRNSPDRRPRRAAYVLPTLLTAGNIFLGFLAILKSFQGALLAMTGQLGANPHFELAAKAIGVAAVLDGLDGRIARMTGTTSEFGREMDSLADVISFGLAPAVLALAWGLNSWTAPGAVSERATAQVRLLCRLPVPALRRGSPRQVQRAKEPGAEEPGKVEPEVLRGSADSGRGGDGGSGGVRADSAPLEYWPLSLAWLGLVMLLAFLMVSTWRYRSLKDVQLLRPLSPLTVIVWGAAFYLIWNFSQAVLLAMACSYVGSGIVVRAAGALRRRFRPAHPEPERQLG